MGNSKWQTYDFDRHQLNKRSDLYDSTIHFRDSSNGHREIGVISMDEGTYKNKLTESNISFD